MNVITDTWRGLVQRKLWPVALLLLVALVAVPLKLAKTPEPAPVQAANAAATAEADLSNTYVTAADDTEADDESDATERRRTLGKAKDPFEPAPLPKAKKSSKKKSSAKDKSSTDSTDTTSGSGSGSGGSSTGGATTPPASPAPTATATPAPPSYPKYSIKVHFGPVDGELTTKTVNRLAVLPSADDPVLVYRGVEDGGKVAVFELTGTVVAQGDGKCEPSSNDCQILKLKAGETEFLTISDTGDAATDAQYQLDLVKINQGTTANKSELMKSGSAGHAVLKSISQERKPSYVFDPTSGTLHHLSSQEAAKLGKAALAAGL